MAQTKAQVEVRSHLGFHGRWLFIDKGRAFSSDASFKDGGRGAMAVLSETLDVFEETYRHFEQLWSMAQIEF